MCRPILEYAAEVWDPHLKQHQNMLEQVQSKAVRFILNLKGICSITDSRESLGLLSLQDRRKSKRINLFMQILSDNTHSVLIDSFNQLCTSRQAEHTTRSVAHYNNLYVFQTNLNFFHNSFIPRTSRDLRLGASVWAAEISWSEGFHFPKLGSRITNSQEEEEKKFYSTHIHV